MYTPAAKDRGDTKLRLRMFVGTLSVRTICVVSSKVVVTQYSLWKCWHGLGFGLYACVQSWLISMYFLICLRPSWMQTCYECSPELVVLIRRS